MGHYVHLFQADMVYEVQQEIGTYARQMSTSALLPPREQQVSFLKRVEEKLRTVYAAITCTRASDVHPQRATRRPPRVPSQPQVTPTQRHQPRPRFAPQSTPMPPPPDQAGGSTWHEMPHVDQQQQAWQPQQTCPPWTMHQSATPHDSSSGSEWFQQDPLADTQDYQSAAAYGGIFSTPPPQYTQDTQPDPESFFPTRNIGAPHRYGWTSPRPPPPRIPRLRRGRQG